MNSDVVRERGLELFCASDKITKQVLLLHMAAKLLKLGQPSRLFSPIGSIPLTAQSYKKCRDQKTLAFFDGARERTRTSTPYGTSPSD